MQDGIGRRGLFKMGGSVAALAAMGGCASNPNQTQLQENTHWSVLGDGMASDEKYWKEIGKFYPSKTDTINLEHGYWGQMALPVQADYVRLTEMVNAQSSIYARKDYKPDYQAALNQTASALGAQEGELAFSRNASESFASLIRQYKPDLQGKAVMWSDTDYPAFKRQISWLATSSGAQGIELKMPLQADKQALIELFKSKIDATPNLQLLLLTHVSNQHGMVFPIKEITQIARARGVDVIADCAQSWGLLDFKMADLDVDWAVFNLHKWIGSPVGVGALYMRKGSWDKIDLFPGEKPSEESMANRIHMATANFASFIAVPSALKFHNQIGGAAKEARLRYLRDYWVDGVKGFERIEVLGGTDKQTTSGMCSFRLRDDYGPDATSRLAKRLEADFNIFTVVRDGLSGTHCIRVTPQVYTSVEDMDALILALQAINQTG